MNTEWSYPGFELNLSPLFDKPDGPDAAVVEGLPLKAAENRMKQRFDTDVGFFHYPSLIKEEEITAMETLAEEIRENHEGVIFFGIGGSHLGPAFVQEALLSPEAKDAFPMMWLNNVDPAAVAEARHFVEKRKCAGVVISKSGGTTETMAGFYHFSEVMDKTSIVAVTDPESGVLRKMATDQGWHTLPVPSNVGGRYSVLTPVGLFPALLAGLSARKLLEGAGSMAQQLTGVEPADNGAMVFAAAKFLWDSKYGHRCHYLMPYATPLELLADWYVQLWAESLGKNGLGMTPVAALGTRDQHSVLQLLKDGPRDKVVGFVDVDGFPEDPVIGKPPYAADSHSFMCPRRFGEVNRQAGLATQKSLSNSGVPTYRIEFPVLDEKALGSMFLFQEAACAFAGELYGVEAFDQPGVEESKKLLKEALAL